MTTKILFGVDRLAVELPLIIELKDEVWYDYSLSFLMKDGTLFIDRETLTVTQSPLEITANKE